jgi:phosphocarrier protein HPr|uniref:HPr family phosphocarrier protein n=1 Tax=Desulfurella acetivorans TaxID=33002 RepID=A0A832AV16_DESAE
MALSKEFILLNKTGLHARPAANLVKTLNDFKSTSIKFAYNGKVVDGKSFISLTSLGAEKNAKITVIVEGPQEQEAIKTIEEMINNKFGEAEE